MPVLHVGRAVEAELRLERRHRGGVGELPRHQGGYVAGHHLRDGEDHHRHHKQDGDNAQQSLDNVEKHGTILRRTAAAAAIRAMSEAGRHFTAVSRRSSHIIGLDLKPVTPFR